jgi:hypothetical protein
MKFNSDYHRNARIIADYKGWSECKVSSEDGKWGIRREDTKAWLVGPMAATQLKSWIDGAVSVLSTEQFRKSQTRAKEAEQVREAVEKFEDLDTRTMALTLADRDHDELDHKTAAKLIGAFWPALEWRQALEIVDAILETHCTGSRNSANALQAGDKLLRYADFSHADIMCICDNHDMKIVDASMVQTEAVVCLEIAAHIAEDWWRAKDVERIRHWLDDLSMRVKYDHGGSLF